MKENDSDFFFLKNFFGRSSSHYIFQLSRNLLKTCATYCVISLKEQQKRKKKKNIPKNGFYIVLFYLVKE